MQLHTYTQYLESHFLRDGISECFSCHFLCFWIILLFTGVLVWSSVVGPATTSPKAMFLLQFSIQTRSSLQYCGTVATTLTSLTLQELRIYFHSAISEISLYLQVLVETLWRNKGWDSVEVLVGPTFPIHIHKSSLIYTTVGSVLLFYSPEQLTLVRTASVENYWKCGLNITHKSSKYCLFRWEQQFLTVNVGKSQSLSSQSS